MKILSIQLNYILHTLIQCNVRATKYWRSVNHEAAAFLGVQSGRFLEKNFKQYLIICFPDKMYV